MKYKISSRATILLGRESVSKVDGAIIELVKNTYDADAVLCFICFDAENDRIYIIDNGIGMTKNTIEKYWMMIGTDNKRENYKSEKNRIKSGEKGIGRFALDRLGSKCNMYTKNKEEKLILWKNDWSNFEQLGKTIDEVEADFEYLNGKFEDVIPIEILNSIDDLNNKDIGFKICIETGTLFEIQGLRDKWTLKEIENILNSMGFLIPPSEQKDYVICFKTSLSDSYTIVKNEIADEYDYKITADFDGEKFSIIFNRNEFDLNKIPKEIFEMDRFKINPYKYEDFKNQEIKFDYSISELMNSTDKTLIDEVKKIGPFQFNYIFMKLSLKDDSSETYFYKEISSRRKNWLEQYCGIKIYRDNFLVRPYGDQDSDSFDWLGLDARKAKNPAGISNPNESWNVRNKQGQGTITISRIHNECILDKSSREGVIENDYFRLFKLVITKIISVFEKDRAYIGHTMKIYSDKVNEKRNVKEKGTEIAKSVLDNKQEKEEVSQATSDQVKTLAKAVQYYEEEREELITEIKLLRSLATNGLITTSIVHDLKSINALLVNRVDTFKIAIEMNNNYLISRCLNDLQKNDTFLHSWITIVTNQKKDKRTRTNKDLYDVVKNIVQLLEPILEQKNINLNIIDDGMQTKKKVFVSDFESIIYNLVINSIESFERSRVAERIINIRLETNTEFIIHYEDNGDGLADTFKNPYEIFRFGVTSKYDINGDQIGTGLGMHIVASTAREYDAKYEITKYEQGFGIDLRFPV